MPIQDSHLEYLAKQINSRNFSDILPVIAFLKRKENENYIPTALNKVVYRFEAVGENQAASQSVFDGTKNPADGAAKTQFTKGEEILLTGKATYRYMNASTVLQIRPAINIIAQIDIGRTAPPTSLPGYQVRMEPFEINSSGVFSFKIPSFITQQLASGRHYVYIDAESPENRPVRLTFAGSENNEASFTII